MKDFTSVNSQILIDFEEIQPLQAMLFFFLEGSRSFNGDFDEIG